MIILLVWSQMNALICKKYPPHHSPNISLAQHLPIK
jgi:hypothetical protein